MTDKMTLALLRYAFCVEMETKIAWDLQRLATRRSDLLKVIKRKWSFCANRNLVRFVELGDSIERKSADLRMAAARTSEAKDSVIDAFDQRAEAGAAPVHGSGKAGPE